MSVIRQPPGRIARLLGFRVVEEGEGYGVLRFPAWLPKSAVRAAVDAAVKDAALLNRRLKVTYGHRYVRFEEQP